jgi:hypothetical protein
MAAAESMKGFGGKVFLDLGSPKPQLEQLLEHVDLVNCPESLIHRLFTVDDLEEGGGDHLGVRTAPYSDRIRLVVTGWLRRQLMQDASLASMFVGDTCTVCQDPNWTVKQKGLQ